MCALSKRNALLGLVVALVGVGVLVSFTAAGAQQAKSDDKTKRLVHVVKYGSAKDVAFALNKFFKGEIEATAAADSNVLLVSAGASVFDEVIRTLGELDRRPQMIALEVTVVQMPVRKGDAADKDFDEKELTGPADAVANHVKALQKKGTVGSVLRYEMMALENQTTSIQQGETKPIVVGLTTRAGGGTSKNVRYSNVGTSVQATPRLGTDKTVLLDLKIEDSHLFTPEDGIVIGMDDGKPVIMAETVLAKFDGKLNVTAGQAVLVQGVQSTSKSGKARTFVIVSARVVP